MFSVHVTGVAVIENRDVEVDSRYLVQHLQVEPQGVSKRVVQVEYFCANGGLHFSPDNILQ